MSGSPQLPSRGRLILAAVVGVLFVGSIVVSVVVWKDASRGTRAGLVVGIVALYFTFSATLVAVVTHRRHIPQLSSRGRLILAAVAGVLFVSSIVVTVVGWKDASLGTRAALVLGIVSLFFTFSATLVPVVTYRRRR